MFSRQVLKTQFCKIFPNFESLNSWCCNGTTATDQIYCNAIIGLNEIVLDDDNNCCIPNDDNNEHKGVMRNIMNEDLCNKLKDPHGN